MLNVVALGAIETNFAEGAMRDNPKSNNFIASQTALGRVGLPDDIGGRSHPYFQKKTDGSMPRELKFLAACFSNSSQLKQKGKSRC